MDLEAKFSSTLYIRCRACNIPEIDRSHPIKPPILHCHDRPRKSCTGPHGSPSRMLTRMWTCGKPNLTPKSQSLLV